MYRKLALVPIVLCVCPLLRAEPPADTERADEASIRQAIASYVDAFNRGDAAAVAAHWAEDGEWISPDGNRFRGRQAIEKELTAYFDQRAQQQKLHVVDVTIRFLAPIVAIEEGTAVVERADQPEETTRYMAVHVKEDGRWKLESVRETIEPAPSPAYRHLEPLAWLIGTWGDNAGETRILLKCHWAKNHSFLVRSFKVEMPEAEPLEGTQVIGWDPVEKTVRSWLFDSVGSFAEATWKHKDDRWVIRSLQTLSTGEKASSINILTPIDENSFRWQSTGREVGGRVLPDLGPVTVVRQGP